jgi:TolA-binding protein
LIDREEWARAAQKFREAVEKYPDGKSTDAALYWLAFCHKKQNQLKEADAALDRLMEKFPGSSWAADARVMKFEIALPRARNIFVRRCRRFSYSGCRAEMFQLPVP